MSSASITYFIRPYGLRYLVAAALFTGALAFGTLRVFAVSPTPTPSLVINELQTGGCSSGDVTTTCIEDAQDEFVELRNAGDQAMQLHGWELQYVSASGATTTPLVTLSGQVAASRNVLVSHTAHYPEADKHFGSIADSGKLAKSGGYLKVVDAEKQVIDMVGWGSAKQLAPWPVVAQLKPGYSVKRNPVTNTVDTASHPTTPLGGGLTNEPSGLPAPLPSNQSPQNAPSPGPLPSPAIESGPAPVPSPADPGQTNPTPENSFTPPSPTAPNEASSPANQNTPATESAAPPSSVPEPVTVPLCAGILISELLPNPAGSDTDQEYIEVQNIMAHAVSLQNCTLQTSANSKTYDFGPMSLAAGEYRAFANDVTGLTLTNTGGSVWLLSAGEAVQQVTYTQTMADNEGWALLAGTWQSTHTITPNAANAPTETAAETPIPVVVTEPDEHTLVPCKEYQERNPETNRCRNVAIETALPACSAGQVRNPETNRCRTAATADTGLAPCKAGETRNPETNRCNKLAVSTAAATCKPGQERNPETNRCKATSAAATTQKPCAAGQVRNTATNRCKKAAGTATLSSGNVKDVRSEGSGTTDSRWVLAVVAVVIALGYAAYEWRREIRTKLSAWLPAFSLPKMPWSKTTV